MISAHLPLFPVCYTFPCLCLECSPHPTSSLHMATSLLFISLFKSTSLKRPSLQPSHILPRRLFFRTRTFLKILSSSEPGPFLYCKLLCPQCRAIFYTWYALKYLLTEFVDVLFNWPQSSGIIDTDSRGLLVWIWVDSIQDFSLSFFFPRMGGNTKVMSK